MHLLLFAIFATALTGCVLSEEYCEGTSKEWHKFGGNCYLFRMSVRQGLSYYDAEDFCRSKGAHLVSILSQKENDFIKDTIASHRYYGGRMWIGLNVLQGPQKYQWSDGQPFGYRNFFDKTQYKKESCYILYGQEGGWRPEHCGLHYTPICKRPASEVSPSPLPPLIPEIPKGNCLSDWIQFGQRCYKYFGEKEEERLTFKEAKIACTNMGENHDLVSIHSMEEQAFLTKHLEELGTSAWIGFNYIENDEIGHDIIFGWTDNSRENFTYWLPGHPPRGTWKYCAYLNYEGYGKGVWMADYCSLYKRGYICKRLPEPSAPEQPQPRSKCDENSVGFRDSCYRYYSAVQNWDQAEKTCKNIGGHLVTISDSFEQNFLYGFIHEKSKQLWTGLRNVKNTRILKWSNGEPLYYSNWADSQPDVSNLESSCVSASADGLFQWNVRTCEQELPFICETTKASTPSLPDYITGDCPSTISTWIDIGDEYCYEEETAFYRTYWGENSRICMSKGLQMITLSSDHQAKSLFSYLWKKESNYWMGLIRSFDKEHFFWTDGSKLDYTNWAEGEPSERSRSDKKDCVFVDASNLEWYPEKCNYGSSPICRAKKIIKESNTPVNRFERSYSTDNKVEAPAVKETQQASQSSGLVSLLIAVIACLGVSVFLVAMVFAWKRKNDEALPTTISPVKVPEENDNTVPKY